MEQRKRKLAAALLASAASAAFAAPLHAVVYAESPSDAGSTLATAQYTGTNNTTPLTGITGTLSSAGDADAFYIYINNAGTFSASTNNALTNASGLDTELFLFSLTGTAIAVNDDAGSGTTVTSLLAAGNSLYSSLTAGRYVLAISSSGNEAVNAVNQLLFAGSSNGSTTATRGAAAGTNPTTLAGFNNGQFDQTTFGSYQIDLTGVNTAVPEPSTWAALALGAVASCFSFLRRRRQQA